MAILYDISMNVSVSFSNTYVVNYSLGLKILRWLINYNLGASVNKDISAKVCKIEANTKHDGLLCPKMAWRDRGTLFFIFAFLWNIPHCVGWIIHFFSYLKFLR